MSTFYRIELDGKFARNHRGIDFVKGEGQTWTQKRQVYRNIFRASYGYLDGNDKPLPISKMVVHECYLGRGIVIKSPARVWINSYKKEANLSADFVKMVETQDRWWEKK